MSLLKDRFQDMHDISCKIKRCKKYRRRVDFRPCLNRNERIIRLQLYYSWTRISTKFTIDSLACVEEGPISIDIEKDNFTLPPAPKKSREISLPEQTDGIDPIYLKAMVEYSKQRKEESAENQIKDFLSNFDENLKNEPPIHIPEGFKQDNGFDEHLKTLGGK